MAEKNTITFLAEGTYKQTCKIHFPPGPSGATIGKGFDLKFHNPKYIKKIFKALGVDDTINEELQKLAGLKAKDAKEVVRKSEKLRKFALSNKQVDDLFMIIYREYESKAKALTEHEGNKKKYGDPDWDSMPHKLKELIIDLTYRGDYSSHYGAKRIPSIQRFIVERDYEGLDSFYNDANNRGVFPWIGGLEERSWSVNC